MSTYLEIFKSNKTPETKEELKSILRKTHESIHEWDVFPEEVDEFWDAAYEAALAIGMSVEEFLEEFKWVEETYVPEFIKENFYLNGYEKLYSELNQIRKTGKIYMIYIVSDVQMVEWAPLCLLTSPAYIAHILRYNIFLYKEAIFLGECSDIRGANAMNLSLKKDTVFGYVGEDELRYRNATEDDVQRFLTMCYKPCLFSCYSYAESFNSYADEIKSASDMKQLVKNICSVRVPGKDSDSFEADELWNAVNSYVLENETLTLSDLWEAMEPIRTYTENSNMLKEPFIKTVHDKLMKYWTQDVVYVSLLKTAKGEPIVEGGYGGIISPIIAANIGFQMYLNPGSYLVIKDKDMKNIDVFRNAGRSFKRIAKNLQEELFN